MKEWIVKHPEISAGLILIGGLCAAGLIGQATQMAERYDAVCAKAIEAVRRSSKPLIPHTQFEECIVSMKREINGFGGQDFTQLVTFGSFEPFPRRRVATHTVEMMNGEVVRIR